MTPPQDSPIEGQPKKILIVDDDSFFRTLLREIITNAGHEVVGEAEDGDVGLRMVEELKPDAIILDLVMPEKNGLDTLQELRITNNPPKVILCTSIKGEKIIDEARSYGIHAYVRKPFQEADIIKALEGI